MSALTLPGTIPGLLRRGSPVVANVRTAAGDVFFADGARAVVFDVDDTDGLLSIEGGWFAPAQWSLDLTDPTGRAHAAWWLNDHDEDTLAQATRAVSGVDDCEAWRWLIVSATSGDAWPDARVEYLRLVCLHVAGVSS
jgi:hypothetical protein